MELAAVSWGNLEHIPKNEMPSDRGAFSVVCAVWRVRGESYLNAQLTEGWELQGEEGISLEVRSAMVPRWTLSKELGALNHGCFPNLGPPAFALCL